MNTSPKSTAHPLGRVALVAASVLSFTGLKAQELQRVSVPDPQAKAAKASARAADPSRRNAIPVHTAWVRNSTPVQETGDAPNFGPLVSVGGVTRDDTDRAVRIAGNPYVLAAPNGDFTPEPGVDPDLVVKLTTNPSGVTWGYIMIRGRISLEKIETLQKLGIEVLDQQTYQSIAARIPVAALNRLAALPFVRWVGYARPHQKLRPGLDVALRTADDDRELDVVVNFFESDMGPAAKKIVVGEDREIDPQRGVGAIEYTVPNGPFQKALEQLGFEFEYYDDLVFAMRGRATRAEILKIRGLDFVASVELHPVHKAFHDQAAGMISQDRVRAQYSGKNVPVAIIDSGIDGTPLHEDLTGKAWWGWDLTSQGIYADGSGHGTHVTGTIAGTGAADRRYAGMAPGIGTGGSPGTTTDRLLLGRYLDNGGVMRGNVGTLYDRFKADQTLGGKILPKRALVNCSWGTTSPAGFIGSEYASRQVDQIVHLAQQTYVFAAGNGGRLGSAWTASPGVAKNVITVGALHDTFSATVRPGDVNKGSRYGTIDGRRKPDVALPGDNTSCKINTTTGYTTASGTSMAAAGLTGCLASVVHRSAFFKYNPSALKALAICSAKAGTGLSYDQRQGFGLINAYKMHNNTSTSRISVRSGALAGKNKLYTFETGFSSSLQDLKIVLTWTENGSTSTAKIARRNDVRLLIDIAPFGSGPLDFDHLLASPVDTVLYSASLANAVRGKRVRFKVFGQFLYPLMGVNWSVGLLENFKPLASSPQLTQTVNRTVVKPGELVTLTARLQSRSTQDEFNSAHIYFRDSWVTKRIERTTFDNILQSYVDSNHPSYPFPSLRLGVDGGMNVGQGWVRELKFWLQAPSVNGGYHLFTQARHHGGAGHVQSNPSQICVDGLAPNAIPNLRSPTHTVSKWSNITKIRFDWGAATDNGCAGIRELQYEQALGQARWPGPNSPKLAPTATSLTVTRGNTLPNQGLYFTIRATDKAGNRSSNRVLGPFLIDTTKPVAKSIVLANGAAKTSSLTVKTVATGSDTYSGIQFVQYSIDGVRWSPLFGYGPTSLNIDKLPGASSAAGVKTVYARFRDRAGNYSLAVRDTIIYQPAPVLNTVSPTAMDAVNSSYFTLTGVNLALVRRVTFGTRSITARWTSAHDNDWANGMFRTSRLGTVLYVYPPQGMLPTTYDIRVHDDLSSSNKVQVTLRRNKGHVLRTSRVMTVGATQTIIVTKGMLKTSVSQQVIMASLYNSPSVLPGIFNFGIGNNFSMFILFPRWNFDRLGNSRLSFPVDAAAKGNTFYFQAGYLDFTSAAVWPMPASDVWSTTYK